MLELLNTNCSILETVVPSPMFMNRRLKLKLENASVQMDSMFKFGIMFTVSIDGAPPKHKELIRVYESGIV